MMADEAAFPRLGAPARQRPPRRARTLAALDAPVTSPLAALALIDKARSYLAQIDLDHLPTPHDHGYYNAPFVLRRVNHQLDTATRLLNETCRRRKT